nr:peptide-methionine (R)-S-oxide reductase MsrB [Micromonospora sp. 4G55]
MPPADPVPQEPEAVSRLDPEQYRVTQQDGTERPFADAYWDNHEPGSYVDVVSGEPLFASVDKYDSNSGWPSFTKPIAKTNVVESEDSGHARIRTEARSLHGDSHLGHVFNDGPPTRVDCATAPTPRRCGSSTSTTWRTQGTANTAHCSRVTPTLTPTTSKEAM